MYFFPFGFEIDSIVPFCACEKHFRVNLAPSTFFYTSYISFLVTIVYFVTLKTDYDCAVVVGRLLLVVAVRATDASNLLYSYYCSFAFVETNQKSKIMWLSSF